MQFAKGQLIFNDGYTVQRSTVYYIIESDWKNSWKDDSFSLITFSIFSLSFFQGTS